MSTLTKPNWFSYAEYLERERISSTKSEYYAGEIFAMAGGSRHHNRITLNISTGLDNRLGEGPCRPFNSDQRIRISKLDLATYPDVSVVCGTVEGDKVDIDAITNPRVLVEVLSPSTESYDRGRKFNFYRHIESLLEYVLISQEEPVVERFKRQPDGDWLLTVYKGLDSILSLDSIKTNMPLKDIYRQIDWSVESPPNASTKLT